MKMQIGPIMRFPITLLWFVCYKSCCHLKISTNAIIMIMNMAIRRKFALETLLNRDKQGLKGSKAGKGDIWVGFLLNIRRK